MLLIRSAGFISPKQQGTHLGSYFAQSFALNLVLSVLSLTFQVCLYKDMSKTSRSTCNSFANRLSRTMNTTQWYAVALGALAAFSIVFFLMWSLIRVVHTYATFYFLKYVFYPQIHRYFRGSSKTTCFDATLIVVFLASNVVCVVIGVGDATTLSKRMGQMSTINLIPLALGGHMNVIVNLCGVRPENYQRMHRWLGRVAIVEGLVHSIMAATSQKLDLRISSQVAALVVWPLSILWKLKLMFTLRRPVQWLPF